MNIVEIDEKTAKKIALAEYLCENPNDLEEDNYDHYGLTQFNGDYAIGTDDEATEAAKEYVKGALWTFSSDFIIGECRLPWSMKDMFETWQSEKCENCNDDLEDIIERLCGMDEFVNAAIQSNGRGHYLGTYDHCENEVHSDLLDKTYYVYRLN